MSLCCRRLLYVLLHVLLLGKKDMIWDRNAKHAVDLVDVMLRFAPGTF